MSISLSALLDGGTGSMREQATANHLDHASLTLRELITPQYRPDEVGLERSKETWENWVGQHETERTELRPETREQVIAAVARAVRRGERVRAVGSGHSHSNAPAPEGTYVELDPGGPGEDSSAGLNRVLEHEGWLKDDDVLAGIGDGLDREHLVRVEAGVILRRLNRHVLHPDGKALANMGSFDGQTIAGAVNTSTHGTGIGLPAISEAVQSVEIVTVPESESGDPIVRLYRIEPTDGITDRAAFEAATGDHEMELIQDDEIFHSVVVGYGCMGVVYAYTLQVVDSYWLREEARLVAWSSLKEELGRDEESVRAFLTRDDTRHCQILVNTAAEQVPDKNVRLRQHDAHGVGQHEDHRDPVCLVVRHKPAEPQEMPDSWGNVVKQGIHDRRWPPERRKKTARDIGKALAGFHPLAPNKGKAKQLHNRFFHPEYRRKPFVRRRSETVWYVALRRLRDRAGRGASEYHHPEPPQFPTPTTEIGVAAGDVVELVDAFRRRVREVKQEEPIPSDDGRTEAQGRDVFFAAPMGIRFTAASEDFLSPEYARATAMVELPLPLPREGQIVDAGGPFATRPKLPLGHDLMREHVVVPALTQVERSIRNRKADLEPRPHMGKHNTVDADWLTAHYEYFDATGTDRETGWYQAYQRFNAFGTFDNAFTEQLGLDDYTPGA